MLLFSLFDQVYILPSHEAEKRYVPRMEKVDKQTFALGHEDSVCPVSIGWNKSYQSLISWFCRGTCP